MDNSFRKFQEQYRKYPENALKLKFHNVKVGYYDSLKLDIWKKKNAKKVLKMRKWSVSVKEIARVFECSEATVYNVLRKNNVQRN